MKMSIYKVKEIIKEAPQVISLNLKPTRGKILKFSPGQYVQVYLPEKGRRFLDINRSYSISSSSKDSVFGLTIKRIGFFSGKIHQLKKGDEIGISGPFGFFTLDNLKSGKNFVFIAGGIGITPIRSMIKFLVEEKTEKDIYLFYSNKKEKDIVFRQEFDELAKTWRSFRVFYTLTQENRKIPGIQERGRLNGRKIKKWTKGLKSSYCFICGSIDFVNALWEDLRKVGVKEEFIKTEAFY